MAGQKGKSGGKRENAGRHSKEQERVKFQIVAYPVTIEAIKRFKIHCGEKGIDFIDELNKLILNSLQQN